MTETLIPQLVREPLQIRSKNTMERILRTAEELVATGTFDRTTVSELVSRAETSVGALYSRFKDKAALRSVLHERFLARLEKEVEGLTDVERWSGEPLTTVVHGLVIGLVDLLRRERGGICSLASGSGRAGRSVAVHARRVDQAICDRVEELLLEHEAEMAHPRPSVAIRVGLTMVLGALRERLVYGAGAGAGAGATGLLPERIEHDDLAAELATAYLGYLQGGAGAATS